MSNKEINLINQYFENDIQGIWKTIEEISKGTRIPESTVLQILTNSGEFVRSSYRQRNGQPLFSTRNKFREKAPFVDKLIGAFKNRID